MGVGRCPENNSVIISQKGDEQVRGLDEWEVHLTENFPEPRQWPVGSRACRYCGGATTEAPSASRVVYLRQNGLEVTPVLSDVRRRYWCAACEKVTS